MQGVTTTHLEELAASARANLTPPRSASRAKRSLPRSYLFFLRTSVLNYLVSFLFDPLEIFRDPIVRYDVSVILGITAHLLEN